MPRTCEAARLSQRLGYAYWFARGRVPSLWAHLRELNLAERYPASPELAQAYSEHAPAMSLIPYFRRGIAYAEKSLEIRKALEAKNLPVISELKKIYADHKPRHSDAQDFSQYVSLALSITGLLIY